jgi:hypothetical protein
VADVIPTPRQKKLVALLTSGVRMSLRRAWASAGYDRSHNPAWDQVLRSPAIVSLFAAAVDQGKPLPPKQANRIMVAICEHELKAML